MSSTALLDDTSRNKPHGDDGDRDTVLVTVDYLGADEPIQRRFAPSAHLVEVKNWAQHTFVPTPPLGKAFYLVDDRREHRFSPEEERRTLRELKYEHEAKLRLVEEQLAG